MKKNIQGLVYFAMSQNLATALKFTPDNARAMAAKSHEARRRNDALRAQAKIDEQEELQRLRQIALEKQILPDVRVAEINDEISRTTRAMIEAETAKDRQALAMALRALYDIWSLLTGHPRPGVRKEVKGRSKVTYAQPQE